MGAAIFGPTAMPPNCTLLVQIKEKGAVVEWVLREPVTMSTTQKETLGEFVRQLFTTQGYQPQRQTPIGGLYSR